MKTTIDARILELRGDFAGDKVIICATYETAKSLNSITFVVPIEQAHDVFVGQRIQISVEW